MTPRRLHHIAGPVPADLVEHAQGVDLAARQQAGGYGGVL
jgi:hypothetical protein